MADPAIWQRYANTRCDLRPTYRHLLSALKRLGATATALRARQQPLDIWIRDWAPVGNSYFRYAPSYAPKAYPIKEVIAARIHLDRFLGTTPRRVPVVLDGGNVVHNGRIAIVTEKVFSDNPHLSRKEIEQAVLSVGFEQIVFIPVEPADEIGHADGMCRFVSECVLLINDYGSASFRSFSRQLRRVLRAAKIDAELVELPWFWRAGRSDGVPSAEGCYMNFIQLAQGIIMPTFGHRKDDKAREVIESQTHTSVATISATPLAQLGGVFNCISLSV